MMYDCSDSVDTKKSSSHFNVVKIQAFLPNPNSIRLLASFHQMQVHGFTQSLTVLHEVSQPDTSVVVKTSCNKTKAKTKTKPSFLKIKTETKTSSTKTRLRPRPALSRPRPRPRQAVPRPDQDQDQLSRDQDQQMRHKTSTHCWQ